MLNMPQRNANATARPVSTSGTQMISVCWRLSAERDSKSFVFQGNGMYASVKGIRSSYDPTSRNQLKPAPSKIALYVLSGFFPVVTRTTRPPMKKAKIIVRSGTASPPAFWASASRAATL